MLGQGHVACGVHWISVYAFTGEAALRNNLLLLQYLGSFLASLQTPWIPAMDANMEPSELDRLDWLGKCGGAMAVPAGPTCFPACGAARRLDFYVLAPRLPSRAQRLRRWLEAPVSPHCPVELHLAEVSLAMTVQVKTEWTLFPVQRPIGPSRKPVQRDRSWRAGESCGDLAKAWGEWCNLSERELCDIHDICGKSMRPYLVRALGFELKQVPLERFIRKVKPWACDSSSLAWRGLAQATKHALLARERARVSVCEMRSRRLGV